jgi:hypothetical protein
MEKFMIKPGIAEGIDLSRNIDELNDQELKIARNKFMEIGNQDFIKKYGTESANLINRFMTMLEQDPKPTSYYKIKTLLGIF